MSRSFWRMENGILLRDHKPLWCPSPPCPDLCNPSDSDSTSDSASDSGDSDSGGGLPTEPLCPLIKSNAVAITSWTVETCGGTYLFTPYSAVSPPVQTPACGLGYYQHGQWGADRICRNFPTGVFCIGSVQLLFSSDTMTGVCVICIPFISNCHATTFFGGVLIYITDDFLTNTRYELLGAIDGNCCNPGEKIYVTANT